MRSMVVGVWLVAYASSTSSSSEPQETRCAKCLAVEQLHRDSAAELDEACKDDQSAAAPHELCSRPLQRAARRGCAELCTIAQIGAARLGTMPTTGQKVQLRVAKGLGTREYGSLRVSVITGAGERPPIAFDYSQSSFAHRWTRFAAHSSLMTVTANTSTPLHLGNGTTAHLSLPPQGAGVAGVLIADPCVRFSAVVAIQHCTFAERFQTSERTPKLLNAFMRRRNESAFWGVLGDNWYDRTGQATQKVFEQLDLTTLEAPMLTVAGNHDYWIMSQPAWAMRDLDQFGNGFIQYYAQDTLAAREAVAGSAAPPFNMSVDPAAGAKILGAGNLPAVDNSFFYHQIGNLGFIGFSGAYPLGMLKPRVSEACAWLSTQRGLEAAFLLGHWDKDNDGASNQTSATGMYEIARGLPGCTELADKGRLKFVMGHTHCNVPHPHGYEETGFMVSGQGMQHGCFPDYENTTNYGVPVVDSTGGRLRMWYFPVVAMAHGKVVNDTFDAVHTCVDGQGWRACTHLAHLWLDQALL